MGKGSKLNALVYLGASLIVVAAYENCGIEKPHVDTMSLGSNYVHTGKETSCNSCHAKVRPQTVVGPHTFNHADSRFGGSGDCVNCHLEKVGVTWMNGFFNHDPKPETCSTCHVNQRPNGIVGEDPNIFDHSKNGLGDCVSCHVQTTRYVELADWAPGETSPVGLIGDRSFNLDVVTPIFNGTVMTKSSPVNVKFPLEIIHSSTLVSSNCVSCHANIATGQFAGGQFHPNIAANPTACLECHKNAQPTGIVGSKGFMRHEAVEWNANTANLSVRGTTKIVTQDCAFCHADNVPMAGSPLNNSPAFIPFNGASFHAKVLPASLNSCLDCHASSRPLTSAAWSNPLWKDKTNLGAPPFSTFDLSRHAINVDCAQCHTAPNSGSSTLANWSNGHNSHTNPSVNCLSCHINPTGVQSDGATSFDHANTVSNCVGCHAGSTAGFPNPVIANWRGGVATPAGTVGEKIISSAVTCTGVAGALPNCTPTSLNKIAKGMTHAAVANLASCTNCHGNGAASAANGKFHVAPLGVANWLPPVVGSCVSCHDPSPAPTNLASIKNIGTVGSLLGIGDGVGHGHAAVTTLNCNSCHTAPTPSVVKTWNTATKIHATLAPAQISSCKECHYKRMPSGALARRNQVTYKGTVSVAQKFTHTNALISVANQECFLCHKDPGISFTTSGKVSFHNRITVSNQCTLCHIAPSGTVTSSIGAGSFNHSAIGAQDCVSCHMPSVPKIANRIPSASDWDGGIGMPHPATGATTGSTLACASCHGQTGTANTRLKVPVANHYNQATTCIGCHSDYTDFATKLKFSHSASTGNCNSCHNFNSGSYSSYTKVATFNLTGTFTLAKTNSITGRFDGDTFTSTHGDARTNLCSSCHRYTAPNVGANVWSFVHRPSNPGVTNSKSTQGCNMCH